MKRKIISILSLISLSIMLNSCSILDKLDSDANPLPKVEQDSKLNLANIAWKKSIGSPIATETGKSIISTLGIDIIVATKNNIVRINSQTGNIVWESKAKNIKAGIASNDKYIAYVDKNNKLIVIDTNNGKKIWDTGLNLDIISSPFIANNIVIIRGQSNKLIAFNLGTQKLLWKYERENSNILLQSNKNSMLSPNKDTVLVGFHNAKMVLLDINTGLQKWEQTLSYSKGVTESEKINDIVSEPIINENTACSVSYQGKIGCFNLNNGALSWEYPFSSIKNLISNNSSVFAINTDSQISSFDYVGNKLWQQNLFTKRNISDGVLIKNSLLFVDKDGYLSILNKDTGKLNQQIELSKISVPIIKIGSTAIIHTDKGNIFAITIN